ncbi:MAG: glutamine synthetase family protein, partial [Acutalibacteraceae bacterium]
KYPDGSVYDRDSRYILKQAVNKAKQKGIRCYFGAELEFYLFKTDENGDSTGEPFDHAGYLDIAPDDKGENVRREICFTLEEMGIHPETSHHEEGPGQNEIDFKYSDTLVAADNALTFKNVVKTISQRNGLYADFSAKPIKDQSGNGFHINISVESIDGKDYTESFMAGILKHIKELTFFMNPTEESYKRFGALKAPKYITWSKQNRSQLIRIPESDRNNRRIELRSPDPMTNPYIAYAMLIHAGLDGIENNLSAPKPYDIDLYNAPKEITDNLEILPQSLEEAKKLAKNSEFVNSVLPEGFIDF